MSFKNKPSFGRDSHIVSICVLILPELLLQYFGGEQLHEGKDDKIDAGKEEAKNDHRLCGRSAIHNREIKKFFFFS
jgi:hypothetical protein